MWQHSTTQNLIQRLKSAVKNTLNNLINSKPLAQCITKLYYNFLLHSYLITKSIKRLLN